MLKCDISGVNARITFDRHGLRALLDEVYGALLLERPYKKAFTKPPLRIEEGEDGKPRYIYPVIKPKGSFLQRWTPEGSAWMDLWRSMIWQILRGVATTRTVYEVRARGGMPSDTDTIYNGLGNAAKRVTITGSLMLGSQTKSAEGVDMRQTAKDAFLLHFWPLVADVTIPVEQDILKGTISRLGYLIGVPDVADVEGFCATFPELACSRDNPKDFGFFTSSWIEAGSGLALKLQGSSLEQQSANIFAVDFFHMERSGNTIKMLSSHRFVSFRDEGAGIHEIAKKFWVGPIKRRALQNALEGKVLHAGMESILAHLRPLQRTPKDVSRISHDAYALLEQMAPHAKGLAAQAKNMVFQRMHKRGMSYEAAKNMDKMWEYNEDLVRQCKWVYRHLRALPAPQLEEQFGDYPDTRAILLLGAIMTLPYAKKKEREAA